MQLIVHKRICMMGMKGRKGEEEEVVEEEGDVEKGEEEV